MIFFYREYGDDMQKNFFKNQTLLLVFSILLGFATIILGVGYAFYVFNINITDIKSLNTVKSMKVDLDVNSISGSLKLCQSYPITVSEGLNCEPYIFSITNDNNADLTSSLNLEMFNTSTLLASDVHIAYTECADATCSETTYTDKVLINLEENADIANQNTKGYLLSSINNFTKGTTKYFKIILWQDENSTLENGQFQAAIGAVSYTIASDSK